MPLHDAITDQAIQVVLREQLGGDPYTQACARRLLEFVAEVNVRTTGVTFASCVQEPLGLLISNPTIVAKVWVDRYDRRIVDEGRPEYHYRLELGRKESPLTEELRSADVAEIAAEVIQQLELA